MSGRLKILLVLPRPLFPADTGGKIRSLSIFSRLLSRHTIHAVSLADRRTDSDGVKQMQKLFPSYAPVFWDEPITFSPAFYAGFLRSRLSRFPYFLAKYRVPELLAAVREQTARESYDVVLCDFLQTAAALLNEPLPLRVVFQHNVEYIIRQRQWQRETHPLKKRLLRGEWEKAKVIEAAVCQSFDQVITVSEDDRRTIESEFGARRVAALPTGVDLEYFRPQPGNERTGNLVFVGSMDWYPNEEGIFWFVREVFPKVRRDVPTATLTVVGRNPSARLRELSSNESGLEITGTVPDVRPYLARAQAVVVPLRIGGGTRIKIFEAMSMQKAVVSTTLGAEGLPLAHLREILLADDADVFAQSIVQLLQEEARRAALADAGRRKVEQDHSWDGVARCMEEILAGVRARSRQTQESGNKAAAGEPAAVSRSG